MVKSKLQLYTCSRHIGDLLSFCFNKETTLCSAFFYCNSAVYNVSNKFVGISIENWQEYVARLGFYSVCHPDHCELARSISHKVQAFNLFVSNIVKNVGYLVVYLSDASSRNCPMSKVRSVLKVLPSEKIELISADTDFLSSSLLHLLCN